MTETLPNVALERRSAFHATLRDVECRQSGNGDEYVLTGYAAVFDSWSEQLHTWAGTFREKIARGAFSDVLKRKPDVRLLFNHDGMTLARTKSGTLELAEDGDGLRVWAKLAPTSQATDLRMAMQRGDIDQMSFAFSVGEDEWVEDHDAEEVERTITRVSELYDVSVVSFPAYPDTEAVMRELRTAADSGKIHPVAEAETDPPGEETAPDAAQAETDPADTDQRDGSAEAETDPPEAGLSDLDELKQQSREALRQEHENLLRLSKEYAR